MLRLVPLIALAALTLSGCDAEGNLGREESPAWHKRTSTAEKVAYFKPACEAYGFTDGTPEMSACVQREIQMSVETARERSEDVQDAFEEFSRNMAAQNSQRLRTSCTTIGRITNCY